MSFPRALVGRTLFPAVCAALLAGCGGSSGRWSDDKPKPVPAGGVVTYNQQPVEGATVLFSPEGHEHPAVGRTDAEGRFLLQTFDPGDGAVPGEYKVAVSKVDVQSPGSSGESGDTGDEGAGDQEDTPPPEQAWLLPQRYASADASGLTEVVEEGAENEFTIELSD